MSSWDPSADSVSRRGILALAGNGALIAAVAAPGAAMAQGPASQPITLETEQLILTVTPQTCRWSVRRKNSPMSVNEVSFLPGDDPEGWDVSSSVDRQEQTPYGPFASITLRGRKAGQMDFEYRVGIAQRSTDTLVRLSRTNGTGSSVELQEMDYFRAEDARLGGTYDRWVSLGTHSRNRDYYELWTVQELVTPKSYAVNHLVRDAASGNCLMMGHVTALRGASRFEVQQGWQDKTADRMRLRGYCSYKVVVPPGGAVRGEELLINLNNDAIRAMEHQGDLIALAHDIRLRQRRPLDMNDRGLVMDTYSRWFSWMSGGTSPVARTFIAKHNLADYWIGIGSTEAPPGAGFGLYGSGGRVRTRLSRVDYPPECFIPMRTMRFGGERVIDFSNPLTIRLEQERAATWAKTRPTVTGGTETDFSDFWDKWPGQRDPSKSAIETWRACGQAWRDAIDRYAPRRHTRSNMNVIDHSYGLIDVCRISSDADRGYEFGASALLPSYSAFLFNETVLGAANRFFYNGRVFWNDGDGFHVYKYLAPDRKDYTAGQAKVSANFRALSCNTILISETFDGDYPEDRIELLKRVSPPTPDTAYPVDLFDRQPAQVWNMPVERSFGRWNVVGVFSYTRQLKRQPLAGSMIQMLADEDNTPFQVEIDASSLRLDPGKTYAAYEFWSKTYVGTFRGAFKPRAVAPYDCDIYAIVEVQSRPTLLSTSRHVRQMAFDIKDLRYAGRTLSGVSRAVPGDPYQLRFHVPEGMRIRDVSLTGGLKPTVKRDGALVTVEFVTADANDVSWRIRY